MSRSPRDDKDYAIDAVLRTLKVFEALEGTNFEPVSVQRVQQRTKFTYDFCRRALITLKLAGFAAETNGGWTVGPKLLLFSGKFHELCVAHLAQQSSEISELLEGQNGDSLRKT